VRRVPVYSSQTLGAAYIDLPALCAGDVLVVRHSTDDVSMLRGLETFLNSTFAAQEIFKARPSVGLRESFPKIAAKDLNVLFENHLPNAAALRAMGAAKDI
jgi:hypothetical protein